MDRGTLVLVASDVSDRGFFRRTFHPYELRLGLFANAQEACAAFPLPQPVVAIVGLAQDGSGSAETIAALREVDSRSVLLLIAPGARALEASELAKHGAYGSLGRPLEASSWRQLVGAALAMAHQSRDRVSYEPLLDQEDWQEAIVGRCEAMHGVIASLPTLADSEQAVLICGEPGTGKTLIARALHQHSSRKELPFVAIGKSQPGEGDRSSGSAESQEDDYERLWPTEWGPAHYADGGTLFIDEVCALSSEGQEELLDLLQRVPSEHAALRIDARLVVASSEPIEEQIMSRRLSQELYDELQPTMIHLPPLRERPGDLRVLIDYFLTEHADSFGAPGKRFAPEVITALERYPWPGNVRELERLVRRALLTSRGETVLLGDLPPHMLDCVSMPETRAPVASGAHTPSDRWMGQGQDGLTQLSRTLFDWSRKDRRFRIIPAMERQLILHALAETRGNQLRAAKLLGISRATLRKRLERLDIKQEFVIR